jgi:hypothetical protein
MPALRKMNSKKQREISSQWMHELNARRQASRNKENQNPLHGASAPTPEYLPGPSRIQSVLQPTQTLRKDLRNMKRRLDRTIETNKSLKATLAETENQRDTALTVVDLFIEETAELRSELGNLKERLIGKKATIDALRRQLSRRDAAARRKLDDMQRQADISMKRGGTVTREFRELIRTLRGHNVSAGNINSVIQAVAATMGIKVTDTVSMHTVHRITLEGYFASFLQAGDAVNRAKGASRRADLRSWQIANFLSQDSQSAVMALLIKTLITHPVICFSMIQRILSRRSCYFWGLINPLTTQVKRNAMDG